MRLNKKTIDKHREQAPQEAHREASSGPRAQAPPTSKSASGVPKEDMLRKERPASSKGDVAERARSSSAKNSASTGSSWPTPTRPLKRRLKKGLKKPRRGAAARHRRDPDDLPRRSSAGERLRPTAPRPSWSRRTSASSSRSRRSTPTAASSFSTSSRRATSAS